MSPFAAPRKSRRPLGRRALGRRVLQCLAPPFKLNVPFAVALAVAVYAFVKFAAFPAVEVTPADRRDCGAFGWSPHATPRRVFDTFAFNSEYFALEARLHELNDVVDYFVLVEATRAFSGKRKPLFFERDKNATRWQPFLHKIIHVTLDDSAFRLVSSDRVTAAVQRKVITKTSMLIGLNRVRARPDDMVIFSDLDEIPSAHVIDTLRSCGGYTAPVSIQTPQFLYDFGCRIYQPPYWDKIRVVDRKQLDYDCTSWDPSAPPEETSCVDQLRDNQRINAGLLGSSPLSVRMGGWHMSYFMSMDKIVEKLESISHIERNTEANKRHDYLQCLKCQCRHVTGRETGHRALQVDKASLGPSWVRQQALQGVAPYAGWYPSAESLCSPKIMALC